MRSDTPSPAAAGLASTTDGLPVAPGLAPTLAALHVPREESGDSHRIAVMSGISVLVAVCASLAAKILTLLIAVVTALAFHGQLTTGFTSPATNTLGLKVVFVTVVGGLIVGFIARYGSAAIRGHGIPEAMEQVLSNQSRISPKLIILKPISSALAIGTGGPFGAEGPIIATGGALGSLAGQLLRTTADERKTLLAAGAAAGMSAIFGTPVAAVLLAVELLLFEYRARSLVPVALAAATADGLRIAVLGAQPAFPMPNIPQAGGEALAVYIAIGALIGLVAVFVTRAVYAVEDAFEKLPVHWMWWPAMGAVVVGVVGWLAPRTLGVGYENITQILSGDLVGGTLLVLVTLKFVSWAVALGSGTAGGTVAPLCTMGGGVGFLVGTVVAGLWPSAGLDPRIAALVGMAAMFAGASRALLTSVVFAFETTRQPMGLLPLLGGCSAAYLVSLALMRHTIMTEKLARRGTRVQSEYAADHLQQVLVRDVAAPDVVALAADEPVEEVRDRIAAGAPGSGHQGFPVIDALGRLVGVVTRRDLLDRDLSIDALVGQLVHRAPVVVYDDSSLREAADHMVRAGVGRLPVVTRADPRRVVGMLSRSDVLGAHQGRIEAADRAHRTITLMRPRDGSVSSATPPSSTPVG